MKSLWPFLLAALGACLLIFGIALWSIPAALVVGGLAVIATAALYIDLDALKGGNGG